MTSGSITKLLIMFAVPLVIGNLFQQLYNTVDSLVVGNFVGSHALAAVGSTTSIINMIVMFFTGTSIGAGVVISRYYGAHDDEKLHIAVETTMAVTFICGIILTGLGIVVAPFMLKFMSTPEDVLPSASIYLKIYFSGVFGLLVYNMGSAILRAVGDTKRPLYFLCLSSVMNIGLDLLFVVGFGMAIEGVAYATIISQFVSAILVLIVLTRSKENYRLTWKDLRIDKRIFRQILMIGLPTGFQQSLTSFSNVYVQSYINTFGSSCMAGWSSYSKIDQFVFLPMQSIGQASTTFMSQNLGSRNLPRAKKGTGVALRLASAHHLRQCRGSFPLCAAACRDLFNQEPDVVRYGTMFLRMNVFMLAFCCPNQVVAGAMRGAGDSRTPMLIMLFSFVLFRQIYLYIATSICNTAAVVGFGYPVGLDRGLRPRRASLYVRKVGEEDQYVRKSRQSPGLRISNLPVHDPTQDPGDRASGTIAAFASAYVFV